MDILKKLWPFSFVNKKEVASLVINVIIHVVGMIILTVLCWLIGIIPFVGGILAWLIGSVGDLYLTVGIVLTFLDYFKVIK